MLEEKINKSQIIIKVTIIGAVVDFLLSVFKITLGYLSNSQSFIADGLHSLSDLLSDALVLFVSKHAYVAPDEEHPYGHEKIETLATLALSSILLLVGVYVVIDGFIELFSNTKEVIVTPILFVVIAISIVSKEILYWMTIIKAKKINSSMLVANAWHHRTDSISSAVVLIGIIGSAFDFHYVDSIAAIIVGIMISYIAWKLSIPSIKELLDSAIEKEIIQELRTNILTVDEVKKIHSFRTRRSGNSIIADIHIQVTPFLTVSEGHIITLRAVDVINEKISGATDIVIHINPEDYANKYLYQNMPLRRDILNIIHKYLDDNDCLTILHTIKLHYINGTIIVDVYFPISSITDKKYDSLAEIVSNITKLMDVFANSRLYFSTSNDKHDK